MKTLNNLILIICGFFLFSSCTATDISGYWKADGSTFLKALHITKDINLYSVEMIHSSNGQIFMKNYLTLKFNRLETGYGNMEYIEGNDILLDHSFETPVRFIRITEDDFALIKLGFDPSEVKGMTVAGRSAYIKAKKDSLSYVKQFSFYKNGLYRQISIQNPLRLTAKFIFIKFEGIDLLVGLTDTPNLVPDEKLKRLKFNGEVFFDPDYKIGFAIRLFNGRLHCESGGVNEPFETAVYEKMQ